MPTRRAALALPAALLAPRAAAAQPAAPERPFPERPVRYVVPFAPGGLTDIMARLVAQKLTEAWGRPVVVENRAGGNAMIGAEHVARGAPPDGHTLLAITLTHAVNVTLFPEAGYDLLRDLTTIAVLGSLPLVAVVPVASPVRDLDGLLRLARTRPLNAGTSGNGSPPHLGLELFRRQAGPAAAITHVPYRGGALAVTDLVAGTLDLMLGNLPEVLTMIRAGRLRPLAVTAAERHRLLPDVPTTAEAGLPDLLIGNWTGMMVHAATPAPARAAIETATLAALRDPDLIRRAEEGGFDLVGLGAAAGHAFVIAETRRWGSLVREAGIRPE